jgi:hypothetical protein
MQRNHAADKWSSCARSPQAASLQFRSPDKRQRNPGALAAGNGIRGLHPGYAALQKLRG